MLASTGNSNAGSTTHDAAGGNTMHPVAAFLVTNSLLAVVESRGPTQGRPLRSDQGGASPAPAKTKCLVIPKVHIDHFTDLDDELSSRIMLRAQRIARRMMVVSKPKRVGMVVHGWGVAHAHLVLVAQHGPHDITSARMARIENGEVVFRHDVPAVPRADLDAQARALAEG